MNETLEQIVARVEQEMSEWPPHTVSNLKFARRLVAALGAQKQVAYLSGHRIASLETENAELRKDAAALWMMLDDIDTASDIAKADDVLYRAMVSRAHNRRFEPPYQWIPEYLDAAMKEKS